MAVDEWLDKVESNRGVLEALADLAKRRHQDSWLATFLAAPQNQKAITFLQRARRATHDGRPAEGRRFALTARQMFARAGNHAGVARSEFEIVYALQRQSEPKKCLREIQTLANLIRGRGYTWLDIQLALETVSCEGMLAHFDSAWQFARQAVHLSERYAYPILNLRAIGFQASLDTNEGRGAQSWAGNLLGLSLFWGDAFEADRGYQFYSDLELMAEAQERMGLALVLQREALDLAEESARLDIAAIGHFRMAGLLHLVGREEDAQREFSRSRRLFADLPATSSTLLYRSYCEIFLASIDIERGAFSSAQQYLSSVASNVEKNANFSLKLAYWKALAELAAKQADPNEETFLRRMIAIGDQGFTSLRSERDRWEWNNTIGYSYRRTLELEIAKPHDKLDAFSDWNLYRLRQTSALTSGPVTQISRRRSRQLIIRSTSRLQSSTVVSYAVLPHLVNVWVADDRGVRELQLSAKPAELERLVREFYRLCSNPDTPIEKVKHAGLSLYQKLLEPLAEWLEPNRTLFIASDGILGMVPFAALTLPSGEYLLQNRTIINTPDVIGIPSKRVPQRKPRVLIVYPGPVSVNGHHYLPLPQAEMESEAIGGMYPGSILLRGEEATTQNVMRILPNVEIFHFAGHADSRDYGGELILNGAEGDLLSASHISSLTLSHLQLAVLSACTTTGMTRTPAQDPNGLVRAFLAAGTHHVIASRWNIDSSATRELMHRLHEGLSPVQALTALRTAQNALRARNLTAHPYFWAGFEVFSSIEEEAGR